MSVVPARVTSQQIVKICPHTSVSGETWQRTAHGTTTGSGSQTSLVDTSADSGGADTYNGRWVKCLSGLNQGHWKRIVDDDGSGTLTLEGNGFPNTVAGSVEYEIWTSPDPVVVVDSSSGETDMVDATRTEADVNNAEYWVGYYAEPITGTHSGKVAEITGFDPATGTFILAASFGSALAAGDVVLLRKFVLATLPGQSPSEDYIRKPQNHANFAQPNGVVGPRGGTVAFNLQAIGSGSLAANATAASPVPSRGLFEACGLEEVAASTATIDAGSSTTSLKIEEGDWEGIVQVGMAVMHNGNVTFVTAITDGGGGGTADTLTVSPALPVAPTTGDLLYAPRMYKKSTDGDVYGCLVEIEHDGVRTTYTGCKGNVQVIDAPAVELAFSFSADHWIRERETMAANPNTAYSSQAPILSSDRVAYLDTTKTDVKGVTATPGTTVAAKMVQGNCGINGRAGYQVTGYAAGMTFNEIMDNTAELTQDVRWTARTAKIVAVVWGSHGNCMAVRMPVARQIEAPHPADVDGMLEVPDVWEAQDAGFANDGTPTSQKVPDWALFFW